MRDDHEQPDADDQGVGQCTAAQDQLDYSVEAALAQYNDASDQELTPSATQYVLIAAQEKLDNKGEVITIYDVLVGGGAEVALHCAMGLVAYGQAFLSAMATRPDRDNE